LACFLLRGGAAFAASSCACISFSWASFSCAKSARADPGAGRPRHGEDEHHDADAGHGRRAGPPRRAGREGCGGCFLCAVCTAWTCRKTFSSFVCASTLAQKLTDLPSRAGPPRRAERRDGDAAPDAHAEHDLAPALALAPPAAGGRLRRGPSVIMPPSFSFVRKIPIRVTDSSNE
jgi:hypothetical protein